MISTWLKNRANRDTHNNRAQRFGSIRLADHKALSNQQSVTIIKPTAGDELILPLQQHMGDKPELIVGPGDYVYKGQPLAQAEHALSVPLHASTSGTITAITERPIPHPSGLSDQCVILQADGLDAAGDSYLPALVNYQQQDSNTLRQRIRDAGIVGLGGAVFPAAIKLNAHKNTQVPSPQACKSATYTVTRTKGFHSQACKSATYTVTRTKGFHSQACKSATCTVTLVINGAECEPYITCDEVLMRDKAREILTGAQIMLHILQVDSGQEVRCLIGIEDNKAQAIAVMQDATTQLDDPRITVVVVPTQYPAGGEKQLIHALTGKEVPAAGRPADIGVICHNVATARAIYRAVVLGEPLISRYVTVTGDGVSKPGNFEVALGATISALLDLAGCACLPPPHAQPFPDQGEKGAKHKTSAQLIMGGPMMGLTLHSAQIPVVKATNCILVSTNTPQPETPLPCIRCGKCAEHCPAGLLPQQLYWYAQARDFVKAESHALFDCIECGCCAYVCPSHIPLVDYYRFAKTEVRSQRDAKAKAELARERHDFHNERLERIKRERVERLAKHKKKAQGTISGDKKDAIQAALERAKAKKMQLAKDKQEPAAENAAAPGATDTATDTTNGARRERRVRRNQENANPKPPSDDQGPQA